MTSESNIAYLAGLFDGEGSVYYKQLKQKRHQRPGKPVHNIWQIRMEIAMTDKDIIEWVYKTLKVGTWGERKVKPGRKRQWRWRCGVRDAYYVARLLWPYVQVKLHKVEQIIDHYSPDHVFDEKVVSLQQYREAMALE